MSEQVQPTVGDLGEMILNQAGSVNLAKASEAAAYAVNDLVTYDQVVNNPSDMAEWINLYAQHVWAYAAIYARASTVAQLQYRLCRVGEDGQELTQEAVLAGDPNVAKLLALLNTSPNPTMTGYDLKELMVIHLDTCGKHYWETVLGKEAKQIAGQTVAEGGKRPVEYWPIRPDYIEVEPDDDGGVKRYKLQTRKHARIKYFKPEEIVPFTLTDPSNPYGGLGRLQPAVDDVQQDKQAAKWNLDFFRHGMTPEGLLTTDKGVTSNEMKLLGDQIAQFLRGQGRKILVLSKGMNWQQISVQPKDVEFLKGRQENRQAILAALGVPPVMVGLLEHAKYDNYALQLEAFNRITVLPMLRKIEGALNTFLLPQWPTLKAAGYRIEFDAAHLTSENEDRLTDRLVKQLESGLITPDEALAKLGRPPYDEPGGDVHYMRSTLVPVATLLAPAPAGEPFGKGEASLELEADEITKRINGLEASFRRALVGFREELKVEIEREVLAELKEEA